MSRSGEVSPLSEPAEDFQEFHVSSNGGDWIISWQPPLDPPKGKAHGASAVCLTSDGSLVLISEDPRGWGLPGGRPEDGESWEDTLVREMREEACARVVNSRLLGFGKAVCIAGPEKDLVLVRSQWLAEVELEEWTPLHEVHHRQVVLADRWRDHLWIDEGWESFTLRLMKEAGLPI